MEDQYPISIRPLPAFGVSKDFPAIQQRPLFPLPQRLRIPVGAADFYLGPVKEIAVVGDPESGETRRLLEVVHGRFLPNKVVAILDPNATDGAGDLPLLEGKTLVKGRPAAYVCENYTCKAPVTEPSQLELALNQNP